MPAPLGLWVPVPGTRQQVRIIISHWPRDRHWPYRVTVADIGGRVSRSAHTEADARAIANEAWVEAREEGRAVLHHEDPCRCSVYDMCHEARRYTGVGNRALND
jgi:hypothetical protein